MKIRGLHLEQVGVFDELDLRFKPCGGPDKAEIHILTGVNGSGKSTILYALAGVLHFLSAANSSGHAELLIQRFRGRGTLPLVLMSLEHGFLATGSTRNILMSDSAISHELKSHTMQSGPSLVSSADLEEMIADLRGEVNDMGRSTYSLNGRSGLAFAAFAYSGQRSIDSAEIGPIQELKTNPFDNALSFHQTASTQHLLQWMANTKTKAAIERANGNTARADSYDRSVARIEDALQRVIGSVVKFDLETEPLEVVLRLDGNKVAFEILPDGLKSIISWIADLLMRMDRIRWVDDRDILERPFALFLDEIDIHLHPAWQRRILPVVQELFPNAQIFVSTHSPFVVGSVSDARVYTLEIKNGKGVLGKAEASRAGHSVALVLNEIFDVGEQFDLETEAQLDRFYAARDALLRGDSAQRSLLREEARALAAKGIELRDLVGSEIHQLERVLKTELPL